jgi:hypothetical protein
VSFSCVIDSPGRHSGEHFADHVAVHIRQAAAHAVVLEGELLVIEAEEVQDVELRGSM